MPQRPPNAWTMAQMITSLEGQSEANRERARAYLTRLMFLDCNCWKEGSLSPKDLRVSSWVLLGLSHLGYFATNEQLSFLINTMQVDGWWAIYTEYPNGAESHVEEKYASTYATALSVLALDAQLRMGTADPAKKARVSDAVRRGRAWLLKTRVPEKAIWWDYPFNDAKSESTGISGLVLHVLHRTSNNATELHEIDARWLQGLPELVMDPKHSEKSSVSMDAFGLPDPSSQFPLQWAIIATVDAYPSGTLLQKAKAIVWIDSIANDFDSLAKGVMGEKDWAAAEFLIALRHLDGRAVI
jgi:hypothetical protein